MEADISKWERCGCTIQCGRIKRRRVADEQERPSNTGEGVAITARRYSMDSNRTELSSSACRGVSCVEIQSLRKFTSPRIIKDDRSRIDTRASDGEMSTGRRVMQDIEAADESDESMTKQ